MSLDPHIVLGLCWLGYFALHSILADNKVKRWVLGIIGMGARPYRLLYNGISLALLWPILHYKDTFNSPTLFDFPGQQLLAAVFAVLGLVIMYIAFKNYSTQAFLGLTDPDKEVGNLATQGLHAYTRHPLYFGGIVFLMGYLLYAAQLSAAIVVGVALLYMYAGTLLEEKKLIAQFGEEYIAYKKKVKMLIPFVF